MKTHKVTLNLRPTARAALRRIRERNQWTQTVAVSEAIEFAERSVLFGATVPPTARQMLEGE